MANARQATAFTYGQAGDTGDGAGDGTRDRTLLDMFRRDLRKYPVLSRDEEAALVKASAAGDVAARNRLVESNLRFVVRVALSSYRASSRSCPGLSVMDLISEGAIGLMRTLAHLDPAVGHRVLSYCGFGIRGRIWRFIFEQRRHVCLSLDDPVFPDEEEESSETFLDRLASADDGADVAALHAQVRDLVDKLKKRERQVITERYLRDKGLEEIGAALDICKSRVHAIKRRALLRLRWALEHGEKLYGDRREVACGRE